MEGKLQCGLSCAKVVGISETSTPSKHVLSIFGLVYTAEWSDLLIVSTEKASIPLQ